MEEKKYNVLFGALLGIGFLELCMLVYRGIYGFPIVPRPHLITVCVLLVWLLGALSTLLIDKKMLNDNGESEGPLIYIAIGFTGPLAPLFILLIFAIARRYSKKKRG